jgi:Carboxypeptidase regulatory-like domain/TonB dependent receptor
MQRSNSWIVILIITLLSTAAMAQTGSIAGSVTDPSGAALQNVQITVRNLATNAVRGVTSSDVGSYVVPNLVPGNYEVTFETPGFKTLKYSHVVVTVAEVVPLHAEFTIKGIAETVEVKGLIESPVEVESSQVSNIVDTTRMTNLPLLTRNPYELLLLSPGTIQSNTRLGGFAVNGSRERNNNFLLDGTDNNDTSVPGGSGGVISLNPEATQEFRVITNNFLPEYGRNTGAIIDIVTKSGSNEFRGDAYWYGRYNGFGGARDFFNTPPDRQNPYVRNQFGFSFGGPIWKDKTFFFVNNEFQRFRTTLTNNTVVPTDAFKSGVFTYNDAENGPVSVNLANANDPSNLTGLSLDPTTQKILALYPQPNGAAIDATRGWYYFPSRSAQDVYNLTTRLDHRFTDNHNLALRYAYNYFSDPNPSHSEFLPGLDAVSLTSKTHGISANYTALLGTNRVNEFKAGFNRVDAPFACGGTGVFDAISGTDRFGRGRDFILPGLNTFGCGSLGDSNGQNRRTGTYSLADNFTWVKGAHTLKFGSEFRFVYEDGFNAFQSRDYLTFNAFNNFDAASIAGVTDPTIQNMGWMLVGLADTETQSQFFNKTAVRTPTDNRKFRQREYGFYAQDSWKFRSNLTFNIGLRYQFNGVPYEASGNLSNLYVPANGPAPFTFQLAGPGSGRLLYNNDFTNLEPRIGFAWDPFRKGKTSVRGAYGIFHDRIFGNLFGNARGNPPFQQDFFNLPLDVIANIPFPADQISSPTVQDGAGIYPVLLDPKLKMPYSQNWNFGVQHEVVKNVLVDLNYIGSKGSHLLRVVDGNAPNPAIVAQLLAAGTNPAVLVGSNLWFGGFTPSPVGNNAFYQAALNRSIANSNYNGFQATVTKRFSRGFQIQTAYTWSHAIDDGSDPLDAAAGGRSFPRNSYNLAAERGNSDFDLRHRLSINYTWELPFGKGRTYLGEGMLGRIMEGFQLSGITSFQTGHPYDIWGTRDSQHTGLSDRAELIGNTRDFSGCSVGGSPLYAGIPSQTLTGVSYCAFANPSYNTASNLGRNQFYGPRYANFDMALAKKTSITERVKLETRFELFNIFNHPQFYQPGNGRGAPGTFGVSTSTLTRSDGTTSARQLQVAMKLIF